MRDGWEKTTLGDVADVLSGFAFSSDLFDKSHGLPLVRIRDLKGGASTETRFSGEYDARYVVRDGDFLIGMDGEFRCYEWRGGTALLNQRVCRIQDFDLEQVVPRYMYFLADSYLEEIENSTSYTTVKHLSVKQVKAIEFWKPSLREQRRIVDLVASVDAYIESLKQKIDAARTARNAVLHDMLSAGGDEWTETTLDELIVRGVVSLGRGNVISKKDMEADPGPYPVYSSAQNNDGRIGFYNKYMFDEELITWSVDGGGHIFYRPHHKFSVTNIGGYLRILDGTKFLYPFLAAVLQKLHSQHVFDWQNKAHPSVIRKLYNNIPIAPLSEQKRIVELVSSMDVVSRAAERAIADVKRLRTGLLSDLLSGNHEIPASYDRFLGAA
jgi:type I restriction enzyme S subunit